MDATIWDSRYQFIEAMRVEQTSVTSLAAACCWSCSDTTSRRDWTACCWTCSDSTSYVQSVLAQLYDAVHAVIAAADTFSGCWAHWLCWHCLLASLFVCLFLHAHLKISSSGKLPFSTTGGGSVVNNTISSPSAFLASFTRCLIYCLSWASPMNPYSFSNCNQHGCQRSAK